MTTGGATFGSPFSSRSVRRVQRLLGVLRFRVLLLVLPRVFLTTESFVASTAVCAGIATDVATDVGADLSVLSVMSVMSVLSVLSVLSVSVFLAVPDDTRYSTRPCCLAMMSAFFIWRSLAPSRRFGIFVFFSWFFSWFFGSPL